jgi:2-keto-4-pentenoate hydratase/2-oxohepta-3-ene-1,7-dioic acid hydratase in catechol pathway
MKLARFDAGRGAELGIAEGDIIVPIGRGDAGVPRDLVAIIEDWTSWRPRLASLAAEKRGGLPVSSVRLLAPIARPGKILGIGLNYADHVAEAAMMERPADQFWFMMGVTAINGPYDPIALPRVSEQLDYEAELVVVIGKRCRYADEAEARAAIFGYAVGNDVSVRDWQFRTTQVLLGKSFDGHAPFGPWIVTGDAVDAGNLAIGSRVNGEVRQASNTRYMMFDPVEQIRHLSQVMTLEPGDLIFTGTPAGVAAAMKPPRWLKAGDVVEVEIEGIGAIRNEVIAE